MKENKEEKELIEKDLQKSNQKMPSPEITEDRDQLTAFIKESREKLVEKGRQRKKEREKEEIELRNGKFILYEEYISSTLREYIAMFPNENPFFKEMFRLAGWTNLDPNRYIKPLDAKHYLVEIIYYRFHKEILPSLKEKAIPGKHKLFQRLTDKGIDKLIQFRNDAVRMMKDYEDGEIYKFRMDYAKKYKTAAQLELEFRINQK